MRKTKTPYRLRPVGEEEYVVQMAHPEDVAGIMKVAIGAGKGHNDENEGFLMDNYEANSAKYRKEFKQETEDSSFFYVAKDREGKVRGFLLAHIKRRWLEKELGWLTDTHWRPDFNQDHLTQFVLLEKIAVDPDMRGSGIGSIMFQRFRQDAKDRGIDDMFSETLIGPKPNFAALAFARKQKYSLAGIRYEEYEGKMLTDIVYHKKL